MLNAYLWIFIELCIYFIWTSIEKCLLATFWYIKIHTEVKKTFAFLFLIYSSLYRLFLRWCLFLPPRMLMCFAVYFSGVTFNFKETTEKWKRLTVIISLNKPNNSYEFLDLPVKYCQSGILVDALLLATHKSTNRSILPIWASSAEPLSHMPCNSVDVFYLSCFFLIHLAATASFCCRHLFI